MRISKFPDHVTDCTSAIRLSMRESVQSKLRRRSILETEFVPSETTHCRPGSMLTSSAAALNETPPIMAVINRKRTQTLFESKSLRNCICHRISQDKSGIQPADSCCKNETGRHGKKLTAFGVVSAHDLMSKRKPYGNSTQRDWRYRYWKSQVYAIICPCQATNGRLNVAATASFVTRPFSILTAAASPGSF